MEIFFRNKGKQKKGVVAVQILQNANSVIGNYLLSTPLTNTLALRISVSALYSVKILSEDFKQQKHHPGWDGVQSVEKV